MTYQSVDELQKALEREVFSDRASAKKAAGRALGTFVELITFYLLRQWGLRESIAIERRIPEYSFSEITHNVEFSLHPYTTIGEAVFAIDDLPISVSKMRRAGLPVPPREDASGQSKSNQLLSAHNVVRNACSIYEDSTHMLHAWSSELDPASRNVQIAKLLKRPYAVIECKRVGVEDGQSRGPQTIEKAKQGAYVARTVSALQKVRMRDGSLGGTIEAGDSGNFNVGDYYEILDSYTQNPRSFYDNKLILTIGITSNHGNWFQSDNPLKELRVLSQSYDWLLFLSDAGLAQFLSHVVNDQAGMPACYSAFRKSYEAGRRQNVFTKVTIDVDADRELYEYFQCNQKAIAGWFAIVSPPGKTLDRLRFSLRSMEEQLTGDIS